MAWDHHWGDRYGDEALEEMGEEVKVALDAADAVMFSDEAIERAAKVEHDNYWRGEISWEQQDPLVKENHRQRIRAIIAALKGEPSV
jgi:hypothetical protein